MFKRPLLVKLFGSYLILEPLIRLILMSIEKDFTIFQIFKHTILLSPVDIFKFWFLFPLSGILLLSYKFYAYIIFMLLQLYSLFFHLNYEEYTWPYLSKYPSAAALVLLTINIFITVYLLFPRSREPFVNRKLRWWETPSRILVNLNSKIFLDETSNEEEIIIKDISQSGASIIINKELQTDKTLKIHFTINNNNFEFDAKVVRLIDHEENSNEYFYGVNFLNVNYITRLKLQVLLFNVSRTRD